MRFVVGSWLDFFKASKSAGLVRIKNWKVLMRPELEGILSRPRCRTVVASHPDGTLYGWAAGDIADAFEGRPETPLLHAVYVKQLYRKMGFARKLIKAAGIDESKPFLFTTMVPVAGRDRKTGSPRCSLFRNGDWYPRPARFDPKNEPKESRDEADPGRAT